MGKPTKIVKDLYLVGSDSVSSSGDCMVYALALGNENMCLIDGGASNADKIIDNINQIPLNGRKLTNIIVTHCHFDHIGNLAELKKMYPNVKIWAHEWDTPAIEGYEGTEALTAASWYGSPYYPVTVDHVIKKDEEKIQLEDKMLLSIHTPGHTPGSISLLYNAIENGKKVKILFGQDIHGPFLTEFNSNIDDWGQSMKILKSKKADILCEGHFGIYTGKENVERFINSHLQRNGKL